MRHVQKAAITFIRLASPVGSLIAAAAETAFPPDSEAQKAIEMLNGVINTKFESMAFHIDQKFSQMMSFHAKAEYTQTITAPLNEIDYFYRKMIAPFGNRTAYKGDFISRCQDRCSPRSILIRMKQRFFADCPMPTQRESKIYADTLETFLEIEKKFDLYNNATAAYENVKRSILIKMPAYTEEAANDMLDTLKSVLNSVNNTGKVERELRKLNNRLANADCWWNIVIEGNEYQRASINDLAEVLRLDLMKTALIGSHCVNISYHDERTIQDELQYIASTMQQIAGHSADWIEAKLKLYWPSVASAHAKKALDDTDLATTRYNSTAAKVKWELDKRGTNNFFHDVLITPNWALATQFFSHCDPYSCLLLNATRGVNLVVVRYPDDSYQRAARAWKWWSKDDYAQKRVLAEFRAWITHKSSENLSELFIQLKRSVAGFADPTLYSHVILLHNWSFFKSSSSIDIGITDNNTLRGLPTMGGLSYNYDPALKDAQTLVVRFFL